MLQYQHLSKLFDNINNDDSKSLLHIAPNGRKCFFDGKESMFDYETGQIIWTSRIAVGFRNFIMFENELYMIRNLSPYYVQSVDIHTGVEKKKFYTR